MQTVDWSQVALRSGGARAGSEVLSILGNPPSVSDLPKIYVGNGSSSFDPIEVARCIWDYGDVYDFDIFWSGDAMPRLVVKMIQTASERTIETIGRLGLQIEGRGGGIGAIRLKDYGIIRSDARCLCFALENIPLIDGAFELFMPDGDSISLETNWKDSLTEHLDQVRIFVESWTKGLNSVRGISDDTKDYDFVGEGWKAGQACAKSS